MNTGFWPACALAPLALGGLFLVAACANDGGPAGGDADGDADSDTDADAPGDCPGALEPLEPFGQVETVGDGSAASCTAAVLHGAVEALRDADGGGSVLFDCGGEHTVVLEEALFVDFPLLIDGGGAIALSGDGVSRVIDCDHYAELVVQRLTIRDGRAKESGAGVHLPWYGSLTAVDVRFEDNHCTSTAGEVGGGGVFAGGLESAVFSGCTFVGNSASNGGGLFNRGSDLTVVDCGFEDNAATSSASSGQFGNGGGIYIDGMNYDDPGDLFLCGSVFENNRATQHGSAVFSYFYEGSHSLVRACVFRENHFDDSPTGGAGGFYHQAVDLQMDGCTFADNRSDQHAAGLFISSGSSATLTNCTFSGNQVPEVGAALFDGASPVDIVNCTFTGNDADYAPAIFKGDEATVSLRNTLFENNTTPNQYSALACTEPLVDLGGNVQWPEEKPSGNADTACADGVLFADPLLEPLADNGGTVPTCALGAGSPAIDHGVDCPPPETDARGEPRTGACDTGAFEAP